MLSLIPNKKSANPFTENEKPDPVRTFVAPGDFFAFVGAFWLTILSVRVGIYEATRAYRVPPALFVHGLHIHHFVLGILCIFAAIFVARQKNFSRWLALLLLGVGSGLLADEAWIILTRQFGGNNYWGADSFLLLLLLGILPFALILTPPKKPAKVSTPATKYPLLRTARLAGFSALALLLFFVFTLANPSFSQAKGVTSVEQAVTSTTRRIAILGIQTDRAIKTLTRNYRWLEEWKLRESEQKSPANPLEF